jgi:phosphate starvation-inducible PhoH-like protein
MKYFTYFMIPLLARSFLHLQFVSKNWRHVDVALFSKKTKSFGKNNIKNGVYGLINSASDVNNGQDWRGDVMGNGGSDYSSVSSRGGGRSGGGGGGFGNDAKKNSIKMKPLSPHYVPRSENQKLYLQHLQNPNVKIVLGVGPAGCGKTLFACYSAIEELKKGNIKKIIITRPLVSVDKEDIGYLPGTLVNKMDPWTRPIIDVFLEFFSQRDVDSMLDSGVIEISPLAYMRGRTFKKCFIIADEMQNSSPNQMLMMTTRIGEGTKLVITGDLKQSDRLDENGLVDLMKKLKQYNVNMNVTRGIVDNVTNVVDNCQIHLVELKSVDVERSPVVVKILDIYKNKPFEDGKINVLLGDFDNSTLGTLETLETLGNFTILERFGNNTNQTCCVPLIQNSTEIINNTLTILKDNSKQLVKTVIKELHDNDCALIPKRDMNRIRRNMMR